MIEQGTSTGNSNIGKEDGAVGKDTHLLYEKDGFLARIILNRPEALNAFSLAMIQS